MSVFVCVCLHELSVCVCVPSQVSVSVFLHELNVCVSVCVCMSYERRVYGQNSMLEVFRSWYIKVLPIL